MMLNVHVIAPTETVWDAPSPEVILPTTTGQVGILTGHISIFTFIDIGVMRIRYENTWIPIFVKGGFAQVEADEVTLLVTAAERGNEIDRNMAESDMETARESVKEADNRLDRIRAEKALKQARARSQAASEFPHQLNLSLPPSHASGKATVSALKTLESL